MSLILLIYGMYKYWDALFSNFVTETKTDDGFFIRFVSIEFFSNKRLVIFLVQYLVLDSLHMKKDGIAKEFLHLMQEYQVTCIIMA